MIQGEDPGLPPRELWLIDPGEKVDTPIDSRGLVDIDASVALVKSLIAEGYTWGGGVDVHHFQWYSNLYPYIQNSTVNPANFRDLPPHKGLLPREFHNFIHAVTLAPPVPDEEVMYYRSEGWRVASSLFNQTRELLKQERQWRRHVQRIISQNPDLGEEGFDKLERVDQETMNEILAKDFKGIDIHLARNEQLPEEFRFFDSNEPAIKVAGRLGKIIMPRHLKLTKIVAA